MSDGPTDMMYDVQEIVEDFLEALVCRYEAAATEGRAILFDEPVNGEILICAEKVRGLPKTVLVEYLKLYHYERFLFYLTFPFSGLEDLFFLLHRAGKFTKLIRLQKATEYGYKLLVFTDNNWRLADNGVYYSSCMEFVDGEQDVLLGFAKQRASGRDNGFLNRQLPLLIVGTKGYARQNWKLGRIFQPSF